MPCPICATITATVLGTVSIVKNSIIKEKPPWSPEVLKSSAFDVLHIVSSVVIGTPPEGHRYDHPKR